MQPEPMLQERGVMNWSIAARDILLFALVGAIVGGIVGVMLLVTDVVDNPFTLVAVGIFVGSLASISREKSWSTDK